MSNKRIVVIACVVAIAAGALFTGSRPAAGTKAQLGKQAVTQNGLPAHVAYEFLFRRAVHFRQRAINAGQPLALDSSLQHDAGLSAKQVRLLGDIAAECLDEVAELDQRARVIIERFRARFPDRVVPSTEPLAPPAELEALQQQRDAAILRGRARLQQAFGSRDFDRFDGFMQARYSIDK